MKHNNTDLIKSNRSIPTPKSMIGAFVLVFLFSINCIAQNPVYKKYTVDDGLPSNEIYQIMQDTKGYIWLATNQGASRFDGNRFENFTIENGMPDNEVLLVFQDKQERIWFKSFTGPLSYYDGIVHNSSNTPWLKKLEFKQTIHVFTPLSNGDILICPNQNNVLALKDTTIRLYDSIAYNNIVEEKDSSVLLIRNNYFMENGKRINTLNFNAAPLNSFTSHYDRQQDILLIVHDSGLYSFHQHKLTYIRNQNLLNNHHGWVVVTSDKEGYFWITDFTNLYRFKVDSDSIMTNVQKYFEGMPINNVFEDKDNNFWFATKGEGLMMVPSLQIRLFNKASGLEDNNITTAQRLYDNKIICGTLNGYIQTINDNDKIEKSVNIHSNTIRKIIMDNNNRVLIVSDNNVFYYDDSGLKKISTHTSSYKSITLSSKGEVIAGGFHVIMKFHDDKMEVLYLGHELYRFYSVCEKAPGEIWAGTEKGLFILKNDSLIPFHPEIKTFTGWIDDIFKTRDGKMLVTTRDSGLAIITNDMIEFINTKDGLQSNTCTSMFYDSLTGKIFLGLNKGLSVISFDQGRDYKSRPAVIKNYNPTNGLLCGSIFSVSESNGEILLSTDRGLLIFNEKDLNSTIETPKVYITSIQINSNNVELKPNYVLNNDANNIRITYNGISFRNAKSLEYRYQLIPFDTGWNTTYSNTVVYPDLPPGFYKFSVQVRTGNGEWFYDNSSFNFTISKPFWTTWLFKISCILFMAIIVIIIYRYQLSKKIEKHLAITADRKRISSEMHDDLGSGLSKISLLSDMISQNTSGEDMKPHLENISRSSKEMVETMGDIIWSMNAKNDLLANLIAYTRKYAMEFFETTSIHCVVVLPDAIPSVQIDGVSRRNIFLVVKEALHNVLKHSKADRVEIKFKITAYTFSITIHDNGKGIDQLKISEFGNGLLNMEKRMKDIGGKFSIRNQDGTSVEISIPIKT